MTTSLDSVDRSLIRLLRLNGRRPNSELAEEVVAAVESNPVDLIETVAERIATVVLAHERAMFTRVTVHKPQAPITVPFDDVSVTITRGRPERLTPTGFSL